MGIPAKDEMCTFDKYIIDEEEKQVLQISQQDYKGILKPGLIKLVKGSFNNRFLYLQNLVEHKDDPSLFINLKDKILFLLYRSNCCEFYRN